MRRRVAGHMGWVMWPATRSTTARGRLSLCQELVDHVRFLDAGEPLVQALVAVAEAAVVVAEQVQDGGVEVADVDGVLDDVVGEVVGLAVDGAALDAAAGQPHGEAARV